jgi:hypothetical protein
MSSTLSSTEQDAPQSFDMFRLSKSKAAVDVAPNTLRDYASKGLPFYRRGRCVFISKMELQQFIRNPGAFTPPPPDASPRKAKSKKGRK